MGLIEMLSRHLISYSREEKWLHDLMDSKRDRSGLYKKAIKHYIQTAGDPEFNDTVIPGGQARPIIQPIPPLPSHSTVLEAMTLSALSAAKDDEIKAVDPNEITADASEIENIMGGLR